MRALLLGSIAVCALFAAVSVWPLLTLPAWLVSFGTPFVPTLVEPEQIVLFSGDVFLGRAVERWQYANAAETPFTYVQTLFESYQNVVINFEAPVPPVHVPTPDFGFNFSVPTTAVAQLPTAGITHVSLANNHVYDHGVAGFEHTVRVVRSAGLIPVQEDYTPTYLESSNATLGLIAVNTVGTQPAVNDLKAAITSVRANEALPVVFIHWGDEYVQTPSTDQRQLAKELAAAGAFLIVGHHPHVVQSIERIGDTIVFYSLGNTVFDQYFSDDVQQGLLLGLEQLAGEWYAQLWPISSIGSRHQPQELTGAERVTFLSDLAAISDSSLRETIMTGAIPLSAP